jgi:DNA-binding NarL/FixJ family response regulator
MTGTADERAITVMLVDDHAVVRSGMRAFFELVDDITVVEEAVDGQDALDRLDALAKESRLPDVLLLDLVMPRLDGLTSIGLIRERHPEVDIVVLTSFGQTERVQAALEAGAAGFLLKDAEADELAAAVRSAHRGEMLIDPGVARRLTRSLMSAKDPDPGSVLTKRESEVLALVAQGLSNREIAERLVITERTARTHVSNVLGKLGLGSRTQAALWAVRQGLVSSSDQI